MHMKAFTPAEATSAAGLLDLFDKNVADGRKALQGASEEDLQKAIPTQPGVSKPRFSVLRRRVINHMVHHRGQLGLYLRLLDVAVPGMYGPSADEK